MKKLFIGGVIIGSILLLCGIGGGLGLYLWASRDLPNFKTLTDYRPPLVTTVYARDGQIMGYFYREKRFLATLPQMAPYVPKAFLAAEDAGFYQHDGVDPAAIFRAFLRNLTAGGIKQGGSTITQQVIKRLLLSSEKSYQRKLKEAILAYRLEKYLTKDEILTIYLNHIYLGAGAYGVEAAARTYFGKHVADLTLAEAAMLAGLPQAPTRYNPYQNWDAAKARQHYVLEQMLEKGWITRQEMTEALAQPLVLKSMDDYSWKKGPWYLEEVRRWLIERYGETEVYEGGLHVWTACDLRQQDAAEQALHRGLIDSTRRRGWEGPVRHLDSNVYSSFLSDGSEAAKDLKKGDWVKVLVTRVQPSGADVRFGAFSGQISVATMHWARKPDPRHATEEVAAVRDATQVLKPGDVVWASVDERPSADKGTWQLALQQEPTVEGAVVSMLAKTGDIVALVGGYSFERSQFNRATQAKRQPGSSFKPIVYSAALDNGFTPASVVLDAPIVFTDYSTSQVWKPENYEEDFRGPTILRTALAKSLNLVTIRVAQRIGISKVEERAKELGLDANFQGNLSEALGTAEVTPLNMCDAYTAFANGGMEAKPRMVLRVVDAWGKELYTDEPESHQAVSPQNAYLIASMMKEVVRDGTGWRARELGRPVAGKTGTTNEERDAWFVGYTPYLVSVVYVGFDDHRPMGKNETGARAASSIWVDYRKQVEDEFPPTDFPQPPGVTMVRIDGQNGLLAGPATQESYFLPFYAGTEPTQVSTGTSSLEGEKTTGEDLLKQVY
ncbi:penicillin-binding protein 1A [Desulfovibrio sp. X2]|uniref:penicillin-binding protein 1A n=1 Tax=Desulfovibrio sp. X2 TaxID=941449 RepID=UPI0005583C5F|nr:PBP1A family penicillin-binding protein [Desulfovibrio sp. X2]